MAGALFLKDIGAWKSIFIFIFSSLTGCGARNLRKGMIGEVGIVGEGDYLDCPGASEFRKLPVLVHIGKLSERQRPIASFIRLISLENCDMAGVDTFAPGLLFPRPEILWAVYDRKLREVLRRFGIEFSDLENQVFESGSQIVKDLPNTNSNTHSDRHTNINVTSLIPFVGLQTSDDGFSLFQFEAGNPWPKILKVFICPVDPIKSAIKRMRKHSIISG